MHLSDILCFKKNKACEGFEHDGIQPCIFTHQLLKKYVDILKGICTVSVALVALVPKFCTYLDLGITQ